MPKKALSSRDLNAIKKAYDIDLFAFSMEAATGDGKLVPDQKMIESICEHTQLEKWDDLPFNECLNHSMDVLANTFGGTAEKKSKSTGDGSTESKPDLKSAESAEKTLT